jgi:hypothetical protein
MTNLLDVWRATRGARLFDVFLPAGSAGVATA